MLSEQEIQLISDYITGALDTVKRQEVEQRIRQDAVFRKEAFFQRLIQEATLEYVKQKSESGLEEARSIVEKLGDDLFAGEEVNYDDIEVDIDIEPTYSLEELINMFKPLKKYERRLAGISRSRGQKKLLNIISPENGADIITGILVVEIATKLESDVEMSIYNNEEDKVLNEKLSMSAQKHKVDISSLKMGRYYLRFKTKGYETTLKSFFVKKKFMPPQFA